MTDFENSLEWQYITLNIFNIVKLCGLSGKFYSILYLNKAIRKKMTKSKSSRIRMTKSTNDKCLRSSKWKNASIASYKNKSVQFTSLRNELPCDNYWGLLPTAVYWSLYPYSKTEFRFSENKTNYKHHFLKKKMAYFHSKI